MTVFHSCLPSQSPSIIVLALSYFTCIILHSSRVLDCMHVLELCIYMHMLKACMCMHVSQALHVSASYQEMIRYLYLLAHIERSVYICIRWLVSRAERLSACGSRAELSVYLHSVPCVESCACVCMCQACVVCVCLVCWQVLRAERVSSCAERVSEPSGNLS